MKLIADYEANHQRLVDAIQSNNSCEIKRFRKISQEVWNDLLLVHPGSKEKAFQLIEFFVGHIRLDDDDDLLNQQCKWKILDLTKSLAERSVYSEQPNRGRI